MQPEAITAQESPAIRAALARAPSVNPARLTVGVHLPYTGRETHIFSRYGYFVPPGYHANCNNKPSTCLRILFKDRSWGRFYFARQAGIALGALGFAYFLCWGPLDHALLNLRQKQRERRQKMMEGS